MMGKRAVTVEQNNNQTYTSSNQNNQQIQENQRGMVGSNGGNNKNAIYGWRKQCLYFIIFLLMVLISINLALTLWVLKVLEVSKDGMGQMRIVEGGIQLEGQAIILDELKTSHIKSRHGQPLTFESSRNLTFNTRDANGEVENQLFLGHDKFEIHAKKFKVTDPYGRTLFYVDRDLVEIAADKLRIEGDGGLIFENSIQTPIVKAEPGQDLKLESPTRSIEMQASQELFIQSRAGSIEASSLEDITLRAKNIRFDAEGIIVSNMKTTRPPSYYEKSKPDRSTDYKFYQVCICENGRLFLAPSHGNTSCAADDANVCR